MNTAELVRVDEDGHTVLVAGVMVAACRSPEKAAALCESLRVALAAELDRLAGLGGGE